MTITVMPKTPSSSLPLFLLRNSGIHGTGVFARRRIRAGECIIEYKGQRITWPEALRRTEARKHPINHTFYFSLSDGKVIDGETRGNEARFINHSCDPNCEAIEHKGGRVFIYALREIERGEELRYSYPLVYDGRHTAAVKEAFRCRCGAANCTGSMLSPRNRPKTRVTS